MKFQLDETRGQATISQIGDYLRRHGAGRHWIEKYRGDVYICTVDSRDEAILGDDFSDCLTLVDENRKRQH